MNPVQVSQVRTLVFSGSQRRASLNQRLALLLADMLAGTVDVLDPATIQLPLFNADLESDPKIRERVAGLYERFARASGFLIVSPEYNGSVSPFLKNTIDWVSRLQRVAPQDGYVNPFVEKPLLLACAASGWAGGLLGLQAARGVFTYLGAQTLPQSLSLPFAQHAWDTEGVFLDAEFLDLARIATTRLQAAMDAAAPPVKEIGECA
jgi:NAD(P)H-dependent FMN reductase